ncbi:MAG: hypothetical protein GXX90_12010, partial [Microbacteriaceae bacterium]|nr:hypothetical protein [Microbacteriaceae bacterium]
MTVEPARRRPRRGALALRRLAAGGIGTGVGVFAAAAAVLFVGAAWPVGLAIGAVIGLGSALLMTPRAPGLIEIPGTDAIAPTTVESTLDATLRSADEMDAAMRRLQSRPLWSGSDLDERIHRLIGGVRTLATTPAMQARGRIDGDVHMLHVLGTDYLPTIVNLAIENDRMHSSFSGRSARAEVEKNVRSLEQQAAVLGEALEQIEADVVRGTTKSVYEHAAFLQLRFDQLGTESVLDLDQPLRETPQHETPQRASGAPEPAAAAPAPRAAEQAPSGRPAPQA